MASQRVLLKDQLFNRDKITQLATELHEADDTIDVQAFVDRAMSRLPELELKQRIAWIADCLDKHLPGDFRQAVDLIVVSLPAPCDPTLTDGDFGDFIYAPYGEYVARHGCVPRYLRPSFAAIRTLTTRFSGEFAIRPFVDTFPSETLDTLTEWTGDSHYHVRRLCSEGTRQRLPWARKLRVPLDYAVPLLERLHDDPTRYVTRSVANHLNDISRTDPDLTLELLNRWRRSTRQPSKEIDYIVRHATRSLVRRGHPGALRLHDVETSAAVASHQHAIPNTAKS